MLYQEDEISFVRAQDCCVCFVDIVDSTIVTSNINNPQKVRKYYEIFLNTMAAIARNFGAKIIKNVGDCLILCYPRTSDTSNKHFVNINPSHYNTAIILLARSLEGERRLHFSLS